MIHIGHFLAAIAICLTLIVGAFAGTGYVAGTYSTAMSGPAQAANIRMGE